MDEQRRRIIEDLSGALDGELRSDPITIAMYSSDASLYQIEPLGVAFPKHRDDVITLAKYSSEAHIPLIARGAGTSVAGQSIGNGLIVDFSRHMRRIESIDEDSVQVQPGIVRDELNRALRKYGRYFPPDHIHAGSGKIRFRQHICFQNQSAQMTSLNHLLTRMYYHTRRT